MVRVEAPSRRTSRYCNRGMDFSRRPRTGRFTPIPLRGPETPPKMSRHASAGQRTMRSRITIYAGRQAPSQQRWQRHGIKRPAKASLCCPQAHRLLRKDHLRNRNLNLSSRVGLPTECIDKRKVGKAVVKIV